MASTPTHYKSWYAASLSGADFETVVGAMRKLNVHLVQAAEGNAELAQSFAAVGARIRNSDGSLRSADEVIGDIAERFKTLPTEPRRQLLRSRSSANQARA